MQIFCSTDFTKALTLLSKSKFATTYGTLNAEIADFFKQYDTFEKVWDKSYMLRENKFIRINKVRLENPLQNSGKSGGYRLITLCDKRTEEVGLIYVYPKSGPHGMENTTTDFLIKIVKSYHNDKTAGKLTVYAP